MNKPTLALVAALGLLAVPAQAHQIWIEQTEQGAPVVRFGEFGDNLREVSPGLLDRFARPAGILISGKTEKSADAVKATDGFTLPFKPGAGDSVVAQDADYPLFTRKQGETETTNRYLPAARLITSFAEQAPKLALDLVPTGKQGEFRLVFQGEAKPKTKVTLVTQSGWAREGQTDKDGLVSFDLPWKGIYVAEVSVTDTTPGERQGTNGPEKFQGVSYVTTLSFVQGQGLEPVPAGPAAPPNK